MYKIYVKYLYNSKSFNFLKKKTQFYMFLKYVLLQIKVKFLFIKTYKIYVKYLYNFKSFNLKKKKNYFTCFLHFFYNYFN